MEFQTSVFTKICPAQAELFRVHRHEEANSHVAATTRMHAPPPKKKCVLPICYIFLYILVTSMTQMNMCMYGDCTDVSYKHFCQQGRIKHNNF